MKGSGGAAQGAMQDSLKNQGLAANAIGTGVNSLNSSASMLNSPLQATTGAIGANASAVAPGMAQGLGTALGSGGNMSGQTGVNQNQQGQNLVNYSANTGGTNLSKANSGLQQFYGNEMLQGMGQPAMLNAQDQLQQQFSIANNTAKAGAAPGTNQAATTQANQNSLLTASGNLAGNLAGQNQAIKGQGAAGVASTASNQDSQIMSMLQEAFSTGQGLNTTALTNLINVLGLGDTALNQGLVSASQGAANTGATLGAEGGLFTGYGGQAQQFGQQASANQQSGGLGGLLGSAAGLFSPIKIGGK